MGEWAKRLLPPKNPGKTPESLSHIGPIGPVGPIRRFTRNVPPTPMLRHGPAAPSPSRPLARSPLRLLNHARSNRKLYALQLRKAGQLFASPNPSLSAD